MADFYVAKIFYPLMNRRLGSERVLRLRRAVLAQVRGAVLEIGVGSGINLACYPPGVESLTAIDVPPLHHSIAPSSIPIRRHCMSAESLAFPSSSFDSVVSTFTLCSILDVAAALQEITRVLKPQGRFFFLEHGKSPDRCIAAVQRLLNPFYNLLACGCNVNRDMLKIIAASGLTLQSVNMDLCGLPFSGLYYSGIAAKKGDTC